MNKLDHHHQLFSFGKLCIIIFLFIDITSSRSLSRRLLQTDYSGWYVGGTTLPRASSNMAAGYDNDTNTIWLLGGKWESPRGTFNVNRTQLVAFNNGEFTDYEVDHFSINIGQDGDYYSQLNSFLYMINEDGNYIQRFNVKTMEIDLLNTTIPITVNSGSCLTSLDYGGTEYLFVVGGNNLNNLQVFDITNNLWLTSPPSMIQPKRSVSCIVHKDSMQLYSVPTSETNSAVEVLSLVNLQNNTKFSTESWVSIGNLATHGVIWDRTVAYVNDILVIGGSWYHPTSYWQYFPQISVIDTTTNSNSIRGNVGVGFHSTTAITVNQNIYCFGGINNMYTAWGTMQMSSWRRFGPTSSPTSTPTLTTISPTSTTSSPTLTPTISPTLTTISPTSTTLTPTSTTSSPTLTPTISPTLTTITPTSTTLTPTSTTSSPTLSPTSTTLSPTLTTLTPTSTTSSPTLTPTTDFSENSHMETAFISIMVICTNIYFVIF